MSNRRAKFLTIERPLLPAPPMDSEPSWYYSNTLGFYKKGKKVWEQQIPEAQLLWKPLYRFDDEKKEWVYWRDEFDKYFRCEVFKDKNFGWQLRLHLSHNYAEIWHKKITDYVEEYHENHFKKKGVKNVRNKTIQ